jgi:hypothetical protein
VKGANTVAKNVEACDRKSPGSADRNVGREIRPGGGNSDGRARRVIAFMMIVRFDSFLTPNTQSQAFS